MLTRQAFATCENFGVMTFVFQFRVLTFLLVILGGCSSTRPTTSEPWEVAAQRPELNAPIDVNDFHADLIARAIYEETNVIRRDLHLRPFGQLHRLDEAADIQASTNALGATAAHSNIVTAWASPSDRVRSVGLTPRLVSENVALIAIFDVDPSHGYNERTTDTGRVVVDGITGTPLLPHTYVSFARAIVRAWMNSPGHRANIVNPEYHYLGCSARPTRSVTGFQMMSGAQVFFTPMGE